MTIVMRLLFAFLCIRRPQSTPIGCRVYARKPCCALLSALRVHAKKFIANAMVNPSQFQ